MTTSSSSSSRSRRHSDAARLRPGDIVTCRVTRADEYQEIGLQLRQQQQQQQQQRPANGKNHYYIIHKVEGLCNNLPLQVGDELVELNGARVSEYDDLEHLEQVLADAKTVEMKVRRRQCPKQQQEDEEEDEEEESLQDGDKENTTTAAAATVGSSRSLMSNTSSTRSLRSTGTGSIGSRRRQATPTSSPRNKKHLQIEYSNNNNDDDDDDDSEEHYDHFERPELLRKESYDGSSVDDSNSNNNVVVFRPGSAAKLANLHDTKAAKLQHQNVFIMHESTKRPGNFECELEDGSRIAVSQQHLAAISEEDEATFQPYVPGRKQPPQQHPSSSSSLGSRSCNGGFQNMLATPNLIEPGDVMKIRGLKKQAKMNGTLVEILRPAEQHSGRWECVLCDDPDRVIAVMSENLRHIM
jgi:hypothetical protein